MRLSLCLFIFSISSVLSHTFNTEYLADDINLENYFVSYVNGTKVITPVSDTHKKYKKYKKYIK